LIFDTLTLALSRKRERGFSWLIKSSLVPLGERVGVRGKYGLTKVKAK